MRCELCPNELEDETMESAGEFFVCRDCAARETTMRIKDVRMSVGNATPKITVKAEIVEDDGQWWVNTTLNDEPLAQHGPIPTQDLAEKVALEQINIAKGVLRKAKAELRQIIAEETN